MQTYTFGRISSVAQLFHATFPIVATGELGWRPIDQALPDGSTVRLYQHGAAHAPAVVLVHGWPQQAHVWAGVIAALGDRFRLIVPDLPGFGRRVDDGSGSSPFVGRFNFERAAKRLAAAIEAYGVSVYDVVGHDVGAWVSLQLGKHNGGGRVITLGVPPVRMARLDVLRGLHRFAYQIPLVAPLVGWRLIRHGGIVRLYLKTGARSAAVWQTAAGRDSFVGCSTQFDSRARALASTRVYRSMMREILKLLLGRRIGAPPASSAAIAANDPVFGSSFFKSSHFAAEVVQSCGHYMLDEQPSLIAALIVRGLADQPTDDVTVGVDPFVMNGPVVVLPKDVHGGPDSSRSVVL